MDLSIHETVTGSIENLFMQYFFDDLLPLPKVAPRQGALHWLGAYDLAACDGGDGGHVMITPTPTPDLLFEWMIETGSDDAVRWLGADPADVLMDVTEVMDAVRRWIAPRDAREVWWEAQERHVAFGGVLNIAEVCANPQFAHRGFFADIEPTGLVESGVSTNGATVAVPVPADVTMPARFVRWSDTGRAGTVPPRPPTAEDTPLEEILVGWAASSNGAGSRPDDESDDRTRDRRPLDGHQGCRFHLGAGGAVGHPTARRSGRGRHPGSERGALHARQLARLPLLLRVEPFQAQRHTRHEAP